MSEDVGGWRLRSILPSRADLPILQAPATTWRALAIDLNGLSLPIVISCRWGRGEHLLFTAASRSGKMTRFDLSVVKVSDANSANPEQVL